jgi:hypothetical protein
MKTKIAFLGIDCATEPMKSGLAPGELRAEVVHILGCASETPAVVAANWLIEAPLSAFIGVDRRLHE